MTDIDILNTSWKTEVTPDQSAEIFKLLIKNEKKLYSTPYVGESRIKLIDCKFIYYYHDEDEGTFTYDTDDRKYFEIHKNERLTADYIIAALRNLEEGDKPVSEETNEDEWIDINDQLPKIGELIEVVVPILYRQSIEKSIFTFNNNEYSFYFKSEYSEKPWHNIKKWRHIKEKRPDFGKLREGDFIAIETNNRICNMAVGFFCGFDIDGDLMIGIQKSNHHEAIYRSEIKKITRINLETREFEEI